MQYRVTVTTVVDDDGDRFKTAEQVKNEIARFAIWNRVAFADKMVVRVEPVGANEKQPAND